MEELDIMRRQLAEMKQMLDTQQIINNELMNKVMRSKASWLNRFVKAELILIPLVYLLFVAICHYYGISQWYAFTVLVFGGIDTLIDIRTVRIPAGLFSTSSILDLKKFLLRQKRERFIQTCISGTTCVIWLILFCYAMFTSNSTEFTNNDIWQGARIGGIVGSIIGAVIGIIAFVIIYRKMQSTNDAIIKDINELQQE